MAPILLVDTKRIPKDGVPYYILLVISFTKIKSILPEIILGDRKWLNLESNLIHKGPAS
jgi:hypothetical protein